MAPSYAIIFMDYIEIQILAGSPIKPLLWKQYIDDVICIWTDGMESFVNFMDLCNSIHPDIRFNWEWSESQALRLCQICSDTGEFLRELKILEGAFLACGYPKAFICKQTNKLHRMSREHFLLDRYR
uniref:Helix-turn-helix domain-containing protein n=1 Tax=Latimeria chalumnae TaxID=7897 RepID=H3B1H6_LATCH